MGRRTLQTSRGDVRLGSSRSVLHASRSARRDDGRSDSVEDPTDAGHDHASVRGVPQVEEFHKFRQIHTDGRQLPADFGQPAWYGYSIGRWEGDNFVVETAGFKEGSWLDNSGHPHTDALRTTERFRRVNFGHLEVDVMIDDSKAYSRPWKADTMRFTLQPDTELLEHLCENNRDLQVLERYWRPREQNGSTNGKQ